MKQRALSSDGDSQVTISKLDALTKQGESHVVISELKKILKNQPPPEMVVELARLAYRNQEDSLALRFLHKVIRNDREKIDVASAEALTVYAGSLMRIGALQEAQECLNRVTNHDEALLRQAFVYFAQWDSWKAIPVLLKYVSSTSLNEYQRLVGRTNLLAAYLGAGKLDNANTILVPLKSDLSQNPLHKLLYSNCLEMEAQILIHQKFFDQALAVLAQARDLLVGETGRYHLFIDKWQAVVKLSQNPTSLKARDDLTAIKSAALKIRHWETIRDCDFHLARLTNDNRLLNRVLLGTPAKKFLQRIHDLYDIKIISAEPLKFCPGDPSLEPYRICLDLDKLDPKSFLNPTSWSLLQIMIKDIYRPPRIGVIFASLYPKEYFNPFTSPQRVRNTVFRFNEWARVQNLQIKIRIENGDFFLLTENGEGISCPPSKMPKASWEVELKFFQRQNESRSFTSQTLAAALGVTQQSAINLLNKSIGVGKVVKMGDGRSSRYKFSHRRKVA